MKIIDDAAHGGENLHGAQKGLSMKRVSLESTSKYI